MDVDLVREKCKVMPALDGRIRHLRIWHCSYQTLMPVGRLLNLRTLVIATYPDVSLEPLRPLINLRYLSIVHLPRIRDLSPLADLHRLQTLSLATLPSWDSTGRVPEVESLEPIVKLPSLRHLALLGVRTRTKSLAALIASPCLESAKFSKYPHTAVDRFYASTKVSNTHVPEADGQ
jgi:hypothetical protein